MGDKNTSQVTPGTLNTSQMEVLIMEKETTKKPWTSPQIIEIEIKDTENGGGSGIDIAGQEVDMSS